jgi:hypothetical protein
MPARYVRAYVKTKKHDAADAEACCEAVQRPGMRFVLVKIDQQQSMLMIHRARDLLVRQRTAAVNALRGHLAEFGIVAAKGTAKRAERKSLLNKQARRQLYPSVAHSRRSGDCGSRVERSDEKRLALPASEPAAFQHRHRRRGKQDSSSRMGGRIDRASVIEGPPDSSVSIGFGCARANGRMMANRSDRNWLIPLALSGSKARQDNWAPVRVSHQGRQASLQRVIDCASRPSMSL